MAQQTYEPPKQSTAGQIIDALLILVLVVASLFAPVWLQLAGGAKTALTFAEKTWAGLGQTPEMQAIWEKLGFKPETAEPIIAARFDYSFSVTALIITALVVIAYFVIVVRLSDKEYREVIDERFGEKR
jgi:hypothetical protein